MPEGICEIQYRYFWNKGNAKSLHFQHYLNVQVNMYSIPSTHPSGSLHLWILSIFFILSAFWFFFFFWPCCLACGISVPRPRIEPRLQQWKRWILTTRPPGNSLPHSFSIQLCSHLTNVTCLALFPSPIPCFISILMLWNDSFRSNNRRISSHYG